MVLYSKESNELIMPISYPFKNTNKLEASGCSEPQSKLPLSSKASGQYIDRLLLSSKNQLIYRPIR